MHKYFHLNLRFRFDQAQRQTFVAYSQGIARLSHRFDLFYGEDQSGGDGSGSVGGFYDDEG